jgi:hypothetical protein
MNAVRSAPLLALALALVAAAHAAGRGGDEPYAYPVVGDRHGLPLPGDHYGDSLRIRDQANRTCGSLTNRLQFMTSRLEAGNNPRAIQIAEEIRSLLAQAQALIDAGRSRDAYPLFQQAEGLFAELGRLQYEVTNTDPNRPAISQNALIEASALHQRLQDHLFRLRDRPGADGEKARSLQLKVQDLLDQCKEYLAAGKASAAKDLALKAEALLAELHLAAATGGGTGSDPSRRRLEDRLHRASDLLLRRQADGADADRLSQATSLLDQARGAIGAAGGTDAAEALLRQAEKILAEAGAAGGRLSSAAFDRLQGKLDRASSLVKAAGSEKASRILEKALDHFGKAERYRREGQKPRAEAELDIALKLAAKAVDIARAAGR